MATTIMAAVDIRQRLKADGASGHELEGGLEAIVRETWPKPTSGRTDPWHYNCDACADSGLELHICRDGKSCGMAHGKRHAAPHEYGTPCWCERGHRFKARQRTQEDAVAVAARVAKPTRFGAR